MIEEKSVLASTTSRERCQLPAQTVGIAVDRFVQNHSDGRVVGLFKGGFYIRCDCDMIAVVDGSIMLSPIYVRVLDRFAMPRDGAQVLLNASIVRIGDLEIGLGAADRYLPTLPTSLGTGGFLVEMLPARVPDSVRGEWPGVLRHAARQNLNAIVAALAGRGEGSTPEGDDILAGIVFVLACKQQRRKALVDAVSSAPTGALSLSFLRAAADGHSVEPMHQLVASAHQSDGLGVKRAAEQIRSIGGSTGEAMLVGLKLGSAMVGALSGSS